jgi:CubicO group peptidase (beta-lactamase class C family)
MHTFVHRIDNVRSQPPAPERATGKALSRLAVAGFALLLAIEPAAAASFENGMIAPRTAQSKRMITAFQNWATRWGVANASISVMKGTTLLGSAGLGSYTAGSIEPVASESKAITAICITQLVEDNKLTFGTKLKTVLADYFKKHPPADPTAKTITVAELLTHSSGITYDPSQGNQGGAVEQLPHGKTNLAKQVEIAFTQNLGTTPGASYYYNNMNYALLGLIVETLTGEPYETYCEDTVLKPVGVTDAKLDPDWRVLASYGGWKISAKDYTRFLEYYLPSMHLLSIAPKKWPQFDLGGGAYYSLGTLMRSAGDGYNFWHEGSFSWTTTSSTTSFGAYFGVLQQDVRYMVEVGPTVSDDAFSDLDASLYDAAYNIANAEHKPKRLLSH